MTENRVKLMIADDHDLIRQGLRTVLDYEPDLIVVGEAKNGEEVVPLLKQYKPDVLLMDINMPRMSGLEVLKIIKDEMSDIKVLILTIENDQKTLMNAIEVGADGYVLKDSSTKEIVEAIRHITANENYIDKSLVSLLFSSVTQTDHKAVLFDDLAEREADILYHIAQGNSNKEIADMLYLSEKTVKNYATKIFRKLEVGDRVQATIFALNHDFIRYYKQKFHK